MDAKVDVDRPRLLEQAVLRSDESVRRAVSLSNDQLESLAAPFVDRLGRTVLGEVLIGAVGAEHVGRAHAADAAVMAVLRRAGRIVRRQVVERRRNAGRVEVVPERHALAPQHRRRRLVVERPEVELELVVADLPAALAGHRLGGRVERRALLVRVAMDEIEDAVRARPGAVDEVGPGDRALRRNAGAQAAEPAGRAQLRAGCGSWPSFIMLSDSRGSMPSMPMTITFLPALRETRRATADQARRPASAGGASGRRRRRA